MCQVLLASYYPADATSMLFDYVPLQGLFLVPEASRIPVLSSQHKINLTGMLNAKRFLLLPTDYKNNHGLFNYTGLHV